MKHDIIERIAATVAELKRRLRAAGIAWKQGNGSASIVGENNDPLIDVSQIISTSTGFRGGAAIDKYRVTVRDAGKPGSHGYFADRHFQERKAGFGWDAIIAAVRLGMERREAKRGTANARQVNQQIALKIVRHHGFSDVWCSPLEVDGNGIRADFRLYDEAAAKLLEVINANGIDAHVSIKIEAMTEAQADALLGKYRELIDQGLTKGGE